MRKNILKIDFSKLRKLEFKTLASKVIEVVAEYDPESLQIKEIYDLLEQMEPQIESLDLGYLAHPNTAKMNELRKKRSGFAHGIINQLKLIEIEGYESKEAALEVAKPIVLQHLQSLWNMGDIPAYQNVHTLISKINQNDQLSAALETLGLNPIIENLKAVNHHFETLYNGRRKCYAERPENKVPEIVSKITVSLKDMFKEIELAQVRNQGIDYRLLVGELNQEIGIYKTKLKTRASINKKKAEGALKDNETGETDGGIVIESSPEEPSESTQTTTQRMIPLSAGVDNEDDLGQLDIKKAVAMSGKETRLPIVSTEA